MFKNLLTSDEGKKELIAHERKFNKALRAITELDLEEDAKNEILDHLKTAYLTGHDAISLKNRNLEADIIPAKKAATETTKQASGKAPVKTLPSGKKVPAKKATPAKKAAPVKKPAPGSELV